MKYKAFISYKHSPKSRKHAEALERALKRYAKPLLAPPIKIFRDEKHMIPGEDLSKKIKEGLDNSEYLLFFAEKEATNSPWCQQELEYWCGTLNRKDKLILVHLDDTIETDTTNNTIYWEATNALPSFLKDHILGIPLYIDLTWVANDRDSDLENIRYRGLINAITAKFRGLTPEEINDQEIKVYRRNRRLRNGAILVLSILLLISIFMSFLAWNQTLEAIKQEGIAQDSTVAAQQQRQIARDSTIAAQLQRDIAQFERQRAQDSARVAQQQRRIAFHQTQIASNERDLALKRATEYKAAAIASNANLVFKQDPTLALNLAIAARKIATIPETSTTLNSILRAPDASFYFKEFKEHKSLITELAVSPDGEIILAGSHDHTISVWKKDGTLVGRFNPEIDNVNTVAYSPDGKKVLIGGGGIFTKSPECLLINIENGFQDAKVKTLRGHTTGIGLDKLEPTTSKYSIGVMAADFSPSSKFIGTAGSGGKIIIWNNKGEKITHFSLDTGIASLDFSPDSKTLATGDNGGNISIWNLEGDLITQFKAHKEIVSAISFSPDGKQIASGTGSILDNGYEKTIKIWNLDGSLKYRLNGHTGSVFSIQYSSDGRLVLSSSNDGTAKVWYTSGLIKETFFGHSGGVFDAAFSKDEKLIYTAGEDAIIKVWRFPNKGKVIAKELGLIDAMDISITGDTIAIGGDLVPITLLDSKGNIISTINKKNPYTKNPSITTISFGPQDNGLIASTYYGEVIWFDYDGDPIKSFTNAGPVFSSSFSPNANKIITGGDFSKGKVFDTQGRFLFFLDDPSQVDTNRYFRNDWEKGKGVITTCSPDNKLIATGGYGNAEVVLWNYKGEKLQTIAPNSFSCMEFSPDSKSIAIGGGGECIIRLYNLSGRLIRSFIGPLESSIEDLSFSSDGRYIAGVCRQTAILWNSDGSIAQYFTGHTNRIKGVEFHPDNKHIITSGSDGTIRKWVFWEFMQETNYIAPISEADKQKYGIN